MTMKHNEAIYWALDVLSFPVVSTKKELKVHYHDLAKKMHPDCGGNKETMAQINQAYEILKKYMEDFKFTFSDEEIAKQYPEELHASRFRF